MDVEPGGRGGRLREFLTPGRVVFAIAAVLTLVFVFENTRQTRIRLLIPEVTMPLWAALLTALVLGVAGGFYLGRRRPHRARRRAR
ncbi:DUF1049 domain-containing protein [Streptomyces bohaiensis]|uniref:DUF1049 domain-containing protein n=1 Tax=Streptomyces bohaiensis TaxID=1431344 RepID=A0ABX1CDH8_9ACTN|nr:DUF1049 domain-containing protein [Streptomyces bohaiensis]NJQ15262.1 DUF1049 domain-containing protein [Streptomyces bohaiensis]